MIDSVAQIEPIGDKVLVARDKAGEITEGGIVIPEDVRGEMETGIVLAVGPGTINSKGVPIPVQVQVRDRVQFVLFAGTDIEVCGKTYMLMPEEQILGVLTE